MKEREEEEEETIAEDGDDLNFVVIQQSQFFTNTPSHCRLLVISYHYIQ